MNDKTEQSVTDDLRCTAAGGHAVIINVPGCPLMVRAVDYNALRAQLAEAQEALQAAQRLFKEALPKFNWAASFLDANAIQLLNEVPAKVNAAIDAAKGEKNGA